MDGIFKVMKGENLEPRLLYSTKLSFRFDREIKSFTEMQKLRKLSITRPALQQMLNQDMRSFSTLHLKAIPIFTDVLKESHRGYSSKP